jgi:hypothetical protein
MRLALALHALCGETLACTLGLQVGRSAHEEAGLFVDAPKRPRGLEPVNAVSNKSSPNADTNRGCFSTRPFVRIEKRPASEGAVLRILA